MIPNIIMEAIGEVYDNAVKHGFHDHKHSDADYKMMIITEISEVINADRNNRRVDKYGKVIVQLSILDYPFEYHFRKYIKDTVEDEFSDVVIRTLDFIGVLMNTKESTFNVKKFVEYIRQMGAVLPSVHSDWSMTECAYRAVLATDFCESHMERDVAYMLAFIDAWAGFAGIDDLWEYIDWKIRYNTMRPKLNGKAY